MLMRRKADILSHKCEVVLHADSLESRHSFLYKFRVVLQGHGMWEMGLVAPDKNEY